MIPTSRPRGQGRAGESAGNSRYVPTEGEPERSCTATVGRASAKVAAADEAGTETSRLVGGGLLLLLLLAGVLAITYVPWLTTALLPK